MRACIGFCLAMLFATAAFAQPSNPCDPKYHWLTPSNCTTVVGRMIEAIAKFRGSIAEESGRIAQARKQFWATYPNKPGAAAAHEEFAYRLYWKDMYYVYASLAIPTLDSDRRNPVGSRQALEFLGGQLDNGIRKSAGPEFEDWVAQVKQNMGDDPLRHPLQMNNDDVKTVLDFPRRFLKAVQASQKKYDVYAIERDWAEFDVAGREPVGLDDPAVYFPALCVRLQKIGWEDAFAEYNGMVKLLGADVLRKAVQEVHAAPKASAGLLRVTAPDPVKRTPSGQLVEDPSVPEPDAVIGVVASPISAVERLATRDDDRRYLLLVLAQEWMDTPLGNHATRWATKWQYADTTYKQLVMAFSEKEVLQAAHQVRTAVKRMTNGRIMNEDAIGATRTEPFGAFEDILARENPRGYVSSALAFNQKLDTTSKIQAAYASFVSVHGEKEVLAAARRAAARRPQLNYDREIEALESEIGTRTSQPAEAASSFDSPSYLKWKGFPSGSKATYIWRGLAPPKGETGDPIPGSAAVRSTYSLQAINSEHADTWFSEVVYDYPSGQAHPPHETEFDYPAKDRNPANARSAYPPFRSGDQTLVIGGRTLRTHWESVRPSPTACPDFLVTTWTSAEVPGELVRRVNDLNCRGNRRVDETLLESTQGSRSPAALAEAEKRVYSSAGVEANSSSPPPFPMALAPGQGGVPGARALPQSMPAARPGANVNAATSPVLTAQPQRVTVPSAQPSHGVTVPQGTLLYVRLAGMVNSSINTQGSPPSGFLDQPLIVNGAQVAPRGARVTVQLADLPNGAGLTLRLTDITIAGRKYSLSTSQVAASTTRTAQDNAAETALNRVSSIAGPAAAPPARRSAAERQRANQASQVLLNGPRIYVPPMTELVFTLAGEFVF